MDSQWSKQVKFALKRNIKYHIAVTNLYDRHCAIFDISNGVSLLTITSISLVMYSLRLCFTREKYKILHIKTMSLPFSLERRAFKFKFTCLKSNIEILYCL